jgi:hypothetical protein
MSLRVTSESPLGAVSAVLEVDVFESFGDDLTHLLVAGPGPAGVEQALRVRRGEVHGQAPKPSVRCIRSGLWSLR